MEWPKRARTAAWESGVLTLDGEKQFEIPELTMNLIERLAGYTLVGFHVKDYPVSDELLAAFAGHKSMVNFGVENAALTDACFPIFSAMPKLRYLLLDGNAAMDTLNEKGALTFNFDGAEVVLTREDLLIDMAQTEGYVSEGDNTVTVILDTNLTPELVEEGFYRELVSKIQTMRKEAGFEVMDHIYVYADNNDTITGIIKKYADQLKSEVLADSITLGQMAGHAKEWNINGETVMLGVAKVTR